MLETFTLKTNFKKEHLKFAVTSNYVTQKKIYTSLSGLYWILKGLIWEQILRLRHIYSPHERNYSILKLTIFVHIPEDTGGFRIFLRRDVK